MLIACFKFPCSICKYVLYRVFSFFCQDAKKRQRKYKHHPHSPLIAQQVTRNTRMFRGLSYTFTWSHNHSEDHTSKGSSPFGMLGERCRTGKKAHHLLMSYKSRAQMRKFVSTALCLPTFSCLWLLLLPFLSPLWAGRTTRCCWKDVPNSCPNPFHTTAVSVSNSQMTVTWKKNLPVLNSGTLKTFNSYQDSLSHFFRFLCWEAKSTASTDREAQLTTVGCEHVSFTTEEPEANFFCPHAASTLPSWVSNSFLKGLFLLLLTYGTKIWSDWSTKRSHTPVATKPRDDMPGQATKEESSFQCCFWPCSLGAAIAPVRPSPEYCFSRLYRVGQW